MKLGGKFYLITFFAVSHFLMACEKNIQFKLNETQPVLVVDAEIENDKEPRVVLTKSLPYYAQLGPEVLVNLFVHDADVSLTDGITTHHLKEYAVPVFPGINYYYYGIDPTQTPIIGQLNTSYQLTIVSDGQTYHTQTTIPALGRTPDSLFFKPSPFNPDTAKRLAYLTVTDPPGLGNYIRYFTKTNSEPFFTAENSVYTDEVIDGTTFTILLNKGYDRNNPPEPNENFFKSGDTVTLKFCNIDKPTYTFWNTWEFAAQAIGNPFSQPNKVIGNISNGALGAFSGYAASYKKVIVN